MLQSVKNSIKHHDWNITEEQSKNILKIAKLLKKNQWIKVMKDDFDLNVTYNQSNEASDKPKGAYFSKGDWFAVINNCTVFDDIFNHCKIAVININDKNIITLKNLNQIIEFAEEYGEEYIEDNEDGFKNKHKQEPKLINWNKVAKDYDGMILLETNIPVYGKIYKDGVNSKLFDNILVLEDELDIIRWKYNEKYISNKEKLKLEREFNAKDDILQAKIIRAKEELEAFQGDILDETYKNAYWTKDYDVTTLVLFNTEPIKTVNMLGCKDEDGNLINVYKNLRKLLKK